MLKFKTHFEQVPLATVRKMVQQQTLSEPTIVDELEGEALGKGFAGAEEPSEAEVANFLTERYRNN
jgi:hypothetical protein